MANMHTLNTLSEFLLQAKTQFRVYDMGRKISKISTDDFMQFESAQQAYPAPLQRHAQFAITFWNKNENNQHYIWFLKFPLDEQGLLIQGTRNSFLNMVVDSLGLMLEKKPSEEEQEHLATNPYVFKPSTDKVAMLNAVINRDFIRPESKYYPAAHNYFANKLGFDQWQDVGVQGICDIATRLNRDNNAEHLAAALPKLPTEPLYSLCLALEHEALPTVLSEALAKLINQEVAQEKPDDVRLSMLIRALSSAPAQGLRTALYPALFKHNDISQTIVALAGRCWHDFNDDAQLLAFFEAAVKQQQGEELFIYLFSDLVAIPSLRNKVLAMLRNPERSNTLGSAIGLLFRQKRS
ncbi:MULTISPECIES: DUF3549 family protein [unclassified Moritella]|uniref:DUF3549 family protein n=1 Tax=unclassified Moritella TaxID=2637987 RepID=UPI001BAD43CA|nr:MULTISPECIES: DUF3549 family protein [unclassified Moritella]QUM83499.1 DUF3549 family protein [Moritella sp. 28]QUM87804.1 DUF3549 family protein [Moritella sp. 36]